MFKSVMDEVRTRQKRNVVIITYTCLKVSPDTFAT